MIPKVSDTLALTLGVCRLHVLTLQVRILSYFAESCLLRCTRLKILRQRVGADVALDAQMIAEPLRRKFRQEWSEVSPDAVAVPKSAIAIHFWQEKWPGE